MGVIARASWITAFAAAALFESARTNSVAAHVPVIITPTQTVAYVGTDTAFLTTVPGDGFAALQWRHDGTNIQGAINEAFRSDGANWVRSTLRLRNLNVGMSGRYDVVLSSTAGTTTSSAAALKVSRAVERIETSPYWSANWNWPYAPMLRVLPNGEFLVAGGTTNLATGYYNIALEKRAPNGEVLWAKRFESHPEFADALPYQLVLDSAGNIYIAGYARCCDSGVGVLAVLKYNPDGQLLWSRTNHGGLSAFAVDAHGNSVMANGSGITRYNHAGDLQWTFPYPRTTNEGMYEHVALAVNDSGDTYLGVSVWWAGTSASTRVDLRKFDSTGALQWTVPYAQLYRSYNVYALAVDGAGDVIVAGFGSPPDNGYASQMFVQKYSPSGQKLWETRLWEFFGGSYWQSMIKMAVGPGNEITLLPTIHHESSYLWGEAPEVNRLRPDGQVRYRIWDPDLLVFMSEPLALDNFGNAYVSGNGQGAVVAKYDPDGKRQWLVNHDLGAMQPRYGLGVGVDAAGDVRMLVKHSFDYLSEYTLVHYRQRDPANTLRRVQLIAGPGGTFHLGVPAQEPFRIEASTDLQSWTLLSEAEAQRLLQPGATSFADSAKRFFRFVFTD